MSLDVYLYIDVDTGGDEPHRVELYSANITHNLGKMAKEAGIYDHLWHPENLDIETAGELVEPIRAGLADMIARPEHYKQFDAPNGWGTYTYFIAFIQKYLEALEQHPKASVATST